MKTIDIIGIGMNERDLTPFHMKLIQKSDLLIGGKRHLAMFPDYPGETHAITRDISKVIRCIKASSNTRRIAVLASGDPLFFGIGNTLLDHFSKKAVRIHPNISSLAAAFSKIGVSWHDAKIVSLHSHTPIDIDFHQLANENKLFFLTAPDRGPAYIAVQMMQTGETEFDLCVLENISHPELEKTTWLSDLSEVDSQTFSHPNVAILIRKQAGVVDEAPKPIVSHETHIGLPDDVFDHSKGLITKSEIRVLSLSKLRLSRDDHTLWDIGAGSGSVSLEAAKLLPHGHVHAIEKHPDRILDIKKNRAKLGITNCSIQEFAFPDGSEKNLPRPDRIFIGGGGQDLEEIISRGEKYLQPAGILVVNTVVIENMAAVMKRMKTLGMAPEALQVQISKSSPIAGNYRFTPLNPVWIISGRKPI